MCWLPLARLLCYTQQQVETSMLSLLSLPVHCLMCLHLPTHVLVVGIAHITISSQKLFFQVRFSPTPSEACCTVNAYLTVVGLCPLTCKLTSCLGFSVFLLLLERWQKFRGAHLVRFLVILGEFDCVMFASHFCNLFVCLLCLWDQLKLKNCKWMMILPSMIHVMIGWKVLNHQRTLRWKGWNIGAWKWHCEWLLLKKLKQIHIEFFLQNCWWSWSWWQSLHGVSTH